MLTEVVWSTMCNMKRWEATLNVAGKGLRSVNGLLGAELISTAYSIERSTTQSAWECDPMSL